MRLAVWSGPRNLSTAMMYSFGAREDFAIMDEPFYAAYLAASGADHPMRDAVLAAHETDPARVAALCEAPPAGGKPHVYQKHMAHHMLPHFPLGWAAGCAHVHLIRHPARVLASYADRRGTVTLEDIGLPMQVMLHKALGGVVVDTSALREDPAVGLATLCDALGLEFDPAMLSWPAGGRPEDGAWAPHWYASVHRSTGFAGPEGPLPELPRELWPLLDAALPYYEMLRKEALLG